MADRVTLTAVVTCHAADPTRIITNLLEQTRRPDEILLFVSDPLPTPFTVTVDAPESPLEMFIVPNRDDFGHEKRAMGLACASCDFIGWFNHDDEYEPTYVERMLDAARDADVVFCNWTNSGRDLRSVGDCEFRPCNSTSGNWIGRTSIVRAAGYNERHYSADASLIAGVLAQFPRIVKIDTPLYHHNP